MLTRYLIATSVFVVYALWPGTKFRLPKKSDVLKICLLGWTGISIYNLGITYGEATVSAGTAGMLIGSAPIFTAIIAIVVLKERLSATGWVGLGVGIFGIFLITIGSEGSAFTLSPGALLILISAIATSFFFVFQKSLLTRYGAIELTAYFTWAGTIPFLIFSPGLIEGVQGATLEANLSAIYLGIFPAAAAYVAWSVALSLGNASTVTSMIYVEPVVAIIVAWFWLKELPSGLSMLGGIIAILSVLIVNGVGRKRGLKEIAPL